MTITTAEDAVRAGVLPTWMVATPYRKIARGPDGAAWAPDRIRHAWRLGDLNTACGLWAYSWRSFHLAFVPDDHESCEGCARRVAELG